ncbi:2-phospho-L-lactate transferase CofD family protein [Klebsiella pneumoniae subsp. pneumoniae]|nr:2-phospho-L-lactate transferase CofD family protein [Klebsiella pneumoniae subsp. pneumoniae]
MILIGPGSFYTSLLPILLLDEMAQALRRTRRRWFLSITSAKSIARPRGCRWRSASRLWERYVGKRVVDAVIAGPKADISGIDDRLVIQTPLEASDVPYRHDRALLRGALEKAIQLPG